MILKVDERFTDSGILNFEITSHKVKYKHFNRVAATINLYNFSLISKDRKVEMMERVFDVLSEYCDDQWVAERTQPIMCIQDFENDEISGFFEEEPEDISISGGLNNEDGK